LLLGTSKGGELVVLSMVCHCVGFL
jgi:hypothetical protein